MLRIFFNFHMSEADELVCTHATINSENHFATYWMLPSNDINMKF